MSEYAHKMGGEALSRQISMSLVDTPQTMLAYREFFNRRDSNREDGWIESKIGEKGDWVRRWFIFDDGVLKYGSNSLDRDDELVKIPMDRVTSIRTDTSCGDSTMLFNTHDFKLYLRFSTVDEMNSWKFQFQKSVAMVLAHLITSSAPVYDDRPSWQVNAAATSGFGMNSFRNKKRSSFAENKTVRRFGDLFNGNRAFTTEDVKEGDHLLDRPTFLDVHRSNSSASGVSSSSSSRHQQIPKTGGGGNSADFTAPVSTSFSTSAMLAMSPAIPIVASARSLGGASSLGTSGIGGASAGGGGGSLLGDDMGGESSQYSEKLAASYKDPDLDRNNLLMLHTRSMSNDSSASSVALSPRVSEDHYSEIDHDDDMQFHFEDPQIVRSRSRSISSELLRAPNSPALGGLAGRKSPRSNASGGKSPRSSITSLNSSVGISLNSVGSISAHAAAHANSSSGSSGRATRIHWRSGYSTKIGPKKANEDTLVSLPYIDHRLCDTAPEVDFYSHAHSGGGNEDSGAYFAIFDGHSGVQAATYLQEHLLDSICRHPQFHSDIIGAIGSTCCDIDTEVLKYCRKERLHCGTTALGAFIIRSRLIVFNIGDCQAILYSNGRAVEMSDSHKANRPDELDRIKRANGWVTEEKELYLDRLHRMDLSDPVIRERAKELSWQTIHRVIGDIAVSRSIGDPDYKGFTPGEIVNEYLAWPADHDHTFSGDLLIPNPEFKTHDLASGDEFLLLASDGLWDVLSPAEACQTVSASLAGNKSTAVIAEEMCNLALKLGSSDNVTCIVVQFLHS